MHPNQAPQLAEMADRRWELLAVAVALMALKSSASAALVLVEQPWVRYLDWFEIATGLGAAGIAVWLLFVKFVRVPGHLRHRFMNLEGYVADTLKSAMKTSWLATFLLLLILSFVADESFVRSVPAEFYLQLAIAVMLGVFSVSFFIRNRSPEDDEDVAGA